MVLDLTPESAYIFRITHIRNIPWILDHGLHCASSAHPDPNFVPIGNEELIGKRAVQAIETEPGGTLSDYVAFYFTPRSPMLLNIKTGWNGVTQRPMSEIVVLASSLHKLREHDVRFLFTDRHAHAKYVNFYDDVSRLDKIDWKLLRASDFSRSDEDPGKVERYQAEALAHGHVPVEALLGMACYSDEVKDELERRADEAGRDVKVVVRREWLFG